MTVWCWLLSVQYCYLCLMFAQLRPQRWSWCCSLPALILVLLIFAKLYCPHIQCGRGWGGGGGGGGDGGGWQPGCVCHCTHCCCCPLQSACPTVGISFGKNTSIFSLNWAWILMSDSTTRHPHYPHLIYGGWKLGKWIKEFLIKNIFILEYLESALI